MAVHSPNPTQLENLPVFKVASADSLLSVFHTQLDAIDLETARLNAVFASEEQWDQWEAWVNYIYKEIEGLPSTPENVKLKARAVWSIVSGDIEEINEGESVCCRMVRQIITGLVSMEENVLREV